MCFAHMQALIQMYYFVSSQRFRREAAHRMTDAVGQKRVPQSFLEEASIPIPLFDEPRRIVAEIEKQFSRLDEAVANLKRAKANLNRYKAAVLKAAFEGKLTEEWRKQNPNVEPVSKLLERILAERRAKWNGRGEYREPSHPDIADLPALPKGWTWATVEQLSTVVHGASPRPAGDRRYFGGSIPWITVGPITADLSHSFNPWVGSIFSHITPPQQAMSAANRSDAVQPQ